MGVGGGNWGDVGTVTWASLETHSRWPRQLVTTAAAAASQREQSTAPLRAPAPPSQPLTRASAGWAASRAGTDTPAAAALAAKLCCCARHTTTRAARRGRQGMRRRRQLDHGGHRAGAGPPSPQTRPRGGAARPGRPSALAKRQPGLPAVVRVWGSARRAGGRVQGPVSFARAGGGRGAPCKRPIAGLTGHGHLLALESGGALHGGWL